jgi:gamma-glutamylcyclotransferase (GGCT)/AIG2-like uncharacterized protein YtfP
MKLFVYGTLLKDMCRSNLLADAIFLGGGFIHGTLYDIGYYPGLILSNDLVYGELYAIDDVILRNLDVVEGYEPSNPKNSLYTRKKITATQLCDGLETEAYTYYYSQSLADCRRIESGDYRRYLMEQDDKLQWYIAYGSNMNMHRLNARIGNVCEFIPGYLQGFALVFNKSALNGSAYANLSFVGGNSNCPCVAYRVTNSQLSLLDSYEGVPSHYIRISTPFVDINKTVSFIGQVYVANIMRLVSNAVPEQEYVDHIRAGYDFHGFDWLL